MARRHHHHSPSDRLIRAGLDGFALVDKLYGRNKKPSAVVAGSVLVTTPNIQDDHKCDHYYNQQHQSCYYHRQQKSVYAGPRAITVEQPVINSTDAARYYRGVEIMDYTKKNPVRAGRGHY